MNERWDLSILYNSFDDKRYAADLASLSSAAKELSALADKKDELSGALLCREYITLDERISDLSSRLAIFANLCASADTTDFAATSNFGRVMNILSETAAPTASIKKRIASLPDLDAIISADALLSEHRYLLENIKKDSKLKLTVAKN